MHSLSSSNHPFKFSLTRPSEKSFSISFQQVPLRVHGVKESKMKGQKGKCFVMQHIYKKPFYQHSKEEGFMRELIHQQAAAAGKGKCGHKS